VTVTSCLSKPRHTQYSYNPLMLPDISRFCELQFFIQKKQNGLCRQCGNKLEMKDLIVKSGTKKRRYYHKECAEMLNII
ncbi:MAG: hypothetical protein ACRD47_14060, partial [Nitrososphaeraceae archaeon]